MCGLFGFYGTRSPDPELLTSAAAAAGRRGPHGCGWATRTPPMVGLERTCHPGPLTDQLDTVRQIRATSVLGHARLATVGDWRQLDQLQPITVAGYALAHNGVIDNPGELAGPDHPTDSIALAHAYAALRAEGLHPFTALDKLVAAADQRAWAIAVLDTNGRLYAHRHYHPLWRLDTPRGIYLSSQQFDPAAQLVPADQAIGL